jgi:hypothetical protein
MPLGRQDFCFTGDFTERGIKSTAMAQFVVDDEKYERKDCASRCARRTLTIAEGLTRYGGAAALAQGCP